MLLPTFDAGSSVLKLTEQGKRVAFLRYVHRMEQIDISEALNISQQAVSKHLAKLTKRHPEVRARLTGNGRLRRLTP